MEPYLDFRAEPSEFFKFKSEVINAMEILRKSFKSLINDTMENPKFTEIGQKDTVSSAPSDKKKEKSKKK